MLDTVDVVPSKNGQIIHLPKATVEIKKTILIDGENYVLAEFSANPGFIGPGVHSHQKHIERFHVLEGEFQFNIGGNNIIIKAGDFLEIPAGTLHDFSNQASCISRWFGIVCPEEIELY